jgi:hypothetical protein
MSCNILRAQRFRFLGQRRHSQQARQQLNTTDPDPSFPGCSCRKNNNNNNNNNNNKASFVLLSCSLTQEKDSCADNNHG